MNGEVVPKLRRFSLGIGLILLVYSLAEVRLDTPAKIQPFGIPFLIDRPNLVGIGLVLASIYSSFRYWYYAGVIGFSPSIIRKRLVKGFLPARSSPVRFSRMGTTDQEKDDLEKYDREFRASFPRCKECEATWNFGENGKPVVVIPKRVRILCYFENVDYYLPVWVNVIALLLYFIR